MSRRNEPQSEELQRVELKYCESCGGLQLRLAGSGIVFCVPCQVRLTGEQQFQVVPLRRKRRKPRLIRKVNVDLRACAEPCRSSPPRRCA